MEIDVEFEGRVRRCGKDVTKCYSLKRESLTTNTHNNAYKYKQTNTHTDPQTKKQNNSFITREKEVIFMYQGQIILGEKYTIFGPKHKWKNPLVTR